MHFVLSNESSMLTTESDSTYKKKQVSAFLCDISKIVNSFGSLENIMGTLASEFRRLIACALTLINIQQLET